MKMNGNMNNTKKSVLFVDNEPNVLHGLKRMLRSERNHFETRFTTSGENALRLLDEEHIDVVVTDMKMSNMNGLQLLTEVKRSYPDIVRIILSGEFNLEMTMKSVNVTHRYLHKPCDMETLKSTILRTCNLLDLLRNESLKQALTQIDSLPSLPSMYWEINRELKKPDASIRKIGEIISQDMAMSSKILQLVNSAYFSVPREISSPEHAAVMLGLDIIKSLVLVAQIFKRFERSNVPRKFFEYLWEHNINTGKMAKAIAKKETNDQKIMDYSFIGGLLHDCGKLILAINFYEKSEEILLAARKENKTILEVEKETLGITHAEAGAYLMDLWGLPVPVVEAIAFHHIPGVCNEFRFSPLTAVYLANILAHKDDDTRQKENIIDSAYLSGLNMSGNPEYWEGVKQKIMDGVY